MLHALNFLLASIDGDTGVLGLHIDFSSKACSMQLNGRVINFGVRGFLEGEDYRAVGMSFPSIGALIDRTTKFQNEVTMTGVHRTYFDILFKVVS